MSESELVFQSYGRACHKPAFFEDFYDIFMGKSDDVRSMFKDTNMEAQRGLLRSGILCLVMHARGMPDTKIRALGESHSKRQMDIKPHYYSVWVDALMETLHRHDPDFTMDLENTWRNVMAPSINTIKSMYE